MVPSLVTRMALESGDQNGANKCQIWKVLHFFTWNIVIESEKIRMVVRMLGYWLHDLCIFPNIIINANITRKSGKNQDKKERHDVVLLIMLRNSLHGLCIARKWGKTRIDMVETVVDNVGVLFVWSVHISWYGNEYKYNEKIRKNQEKKKKEWCRELLTMLGCYLHGLCAFSNTVTNANILKTSRKEQEKWSSMT